MCRLPGQTYKSGHMKLFLALIFTLLIIRSLYKSLRTFITFSYQVPASTRSSKLLFTMDESELRKLFEDDKMVKHYEIGEKVTGQFAQSLLEQSGMIKDANATPEKPLVVFDNACGTGAVSSLLSQQLNEGVKKNWQLTCGDISESMLNYTRRRLQREGWQNALVKVVDAQDTGLPSAHYTHAITAFGKLISQPVNYARSGSLIRSAYMALPESLDALDGKRLFSFHCMAMLLS